MAYLEAIEEKLHQVKSLQNDHEGLVAFDNDCEEFESKVWQRFCTRHNCSVISEELAEKKLV